MALTRINLTWIAFFALVSAIQLFMIGAAQAATKTTTKTIILPVEEEKKKTSQELETPAIPNDALPKFEAAPEADKPVEDFSDPSEDATSAALAPILRNTDLLPEAARKTHDQLVSAAKRADLQAIRELIGTGDTATTLSIGGLEGDPIEFLKETSGDADGYELLAILLEVLEAGFVHVDAGTESEMYVWPYFFTWPFEKLTPQMKVELFRILTAGDVQDSADFGGYIFYRVGIRPNGQWDFFVAGD